MTRLMSYLAGLWRNWQFVEEEGPAPPSGRARAVDELTRLREAVDRDRLMVEHFRRNGCEGLAKDREGSLRAAERRLRALELGARRAV